jgi:hypothetical protein
VTDFELRLNNPLHPIKQISVDLSCPFLIIEEYCPNLIKTEKPIERKKVDVIDVSNVETHQKLLELTSELTSFYDDLAKELLPHLFAMEIVEENAKNRPKGLHGNLSFLLSLHKEMVSIHFVNRIKDKLCLTDEQIKGLSYEKIRLNSGS